MNTETLLSEIREVFPPINMPSGPALRFHPEGCCQCEYLAQDLEEARGKPIDAAVIRSLHQEMSCLSAKGWAWALPHYLPYCLTAEAAYNQMETEFLIYNLGPEQQFKEDALARLSSLTHAQVQCLIHFVEWTKSHPHWGTYSPSEIERALEFLHEIKA